MGKQGFTGADFLLEPGVTFPGKYTVTGKLAIGMCLRDVVQLLADKIRAIEWDTHLDMETCGESRDVGALLGAFGNYLGAKTMTPNIICCARACVEDQVQDADGVFKGRI